MTFRNFWSHQIPHPVRNGTRGSAFDYPEWLIIFMAILSVKAHVKNHLAIHRLAVQRWDMLAEGLDGRTRTTPISASQPRDRFQKICHALGRPAAFIFQVFPEEVFDEEGQCGQDDGQSQRSGLAPEAEETGPHAARIAGAGPRGSLRKILGRRLDIRPWHVQPDAAPATDGRDVSVDAQRRP